MTKIQDDLEGMKIKITMSGHAGYAKENDVVCAAESILMYTLLESLKGAEYRSDEKNAFVEITAPRNRENILIWKTIKRGYRLLEKEYPQNVKIE